MKRPLAWLLALAATGVFAQAQPAALRVCADPDNLPYSHEDGSGFENRIAQLIASDFGLPLEYAWLPDRRGFVRKTLGAGRCELIVGVPAGDARLHTSTPYYRSHFVAITRADAAPLDSFDDPRLPALRLGVQLIGADALSPVGHALAARGAVQRVVGYTLVQDDRPPAQRMVEAVARGELDAAFAWGPQAGWFAARSPVPLRLAALHGEGDLASIPFGFAIAMGTRRDDPALQRALEDFLQRRRAEIDAILAEHAVPREEAR